MQTIFLGVGECNIRCGILERKDERIYEYRNYGTQKKQTQ